jgi:multicomponent Na+:H+ antiporter subunit D
MTKIWSEVFWKARPEETGPARSSSPSAALMGPIIGLLLLTLGIGLWPTPLLDLSARAAGQLLDPAQYVAAVFGGRR